jgi:TRAP-type C4-dicarboxylate transport system permease large subunit
LSASPDVLVGAMHLVSGVSGLKAADMAAVAPVLFPEMKARGASPGDLVALLAATGAQTETVPPSLVLIAIGSVTGVSISALSGGLLPGVVLLAMGIGQFAPPFGVGYYAACATGASIPPRGSGRSGAICWRCWSA